MVLRYVFRELSSLESATQRTAARAVDHAGEAELDSTTVQIIWILAAAFPFLVAVAIGLKSFNVGLHEFLHFEIALLLVESGFGVSTGLILEYLFHPIALYAPFRINAI